MVDEGRPFDDPWEGPTKSEEIRTRVYEFWMTIPDGRRGWLEIVCRVRYSRILAIDEDGDECFVGPHIYVEFGPEFGPFMDHHFATLRTVGITGTQIDPDPDNRIEFFPQEFRENPRKSRSRDDAAP